MWQGHIWGGHAGQAQGVMREGMGGRHRDLQGMQDQHRGHAGGQCWGGTGTGHAGAGSNGSLE